MGFYFSSDMITRDEVIKKLMDHKEEIRSFGVKRIGFLGSFAKGTSNENSDIDIVVEFEKGRATFKNVGGLLEFLEKLLGRDIDLLTPKGIESIRIEHVKEQIKKEVIYV